MQDSEINEAVARKLGWHTFTSFPANDPLDQTTLWLGPKGGKSKPIPDYCHSIEAVWEVVEHVTKNFNLEMDHWERKERSGFTIEDQKAWHVTIRTEPYDSLEVYADTAPMAICKAFLQLE